MFFTTHTPIFQRESYSSLERNHYNLFSFPLPLSYLERRFVLKYNPYLFRVQRGFWNLGNFGDLPKEVSEAWRMQSGVLQDPKSQRRHNFEKSVGSRSLEGSSTWGRLGLEVFCYSYTSTLFTSELISIWRVAERFFAEFFGFLFDNTSWCYLVVAFLFPYSCALLLLFVIHVCALDQLSIYCVSFTFVLHLDKLE